MGVIVVAIGGNSLIRDEEHKTVADQWQLTRETCAHIAGIVADGHTVVVTHGNGPQVGFILRRSEIARGELHEVPLDSCDADTQGAIGYMIQQSLQNEFRKRGIQKSAVTVCTQVVVDEADEAFRSPTKPIGSFMDEATARARAEREGWKVVEDAGRGFRRVVPSPDPKEVVELDAITSLVRSGFIVVAVGGGGIPVVRKVDGDLRGVEAVIDKDFATALLAVNLSADKFVISTAVDKVRLDFNKPIERALDRVTVAEAKRYIGEGHFGKGSMLPKIQAVIRFLEAGGKEAIVTRPEDLERAVRGEAGTLFVP